MRYVDGEWRKANHVFILQELKSQAVKILGSTDFLGNPSGLLHDVTEGVSELVHEGSVGGLVWNVTHGMANSTAKVTGKLAAATRHQIRLLCSAFCSSFAVMCLF